MNNTITEARISNNTGFLNTKLGSGTIRWPYSNGVLSLMSTLSLICF